MTTVTMRDVLSGADRFITGLLDALGVAVLVEMAALSFCQVIARYILKASIPWYEEAVIFSLGWIGMIGFARAVRDNDNIAFELVAKRAPGSLRKVIAALGTILVVVFFAILSVTGIRYTITFWSWPSTVLPVPRGPLYVAIPLGAIASLFYVIWRWSMGRENVG